MDKLIDYFKSAPLEEITETLKQHNIKFVKNTNNMPEIFETKSQLYNCIKNSQTCEYHDFHSLQIETDLVWSLLCADGITDDEIREVYKCLM